MVRLSGTGILQLRRITSQRYLMEVPLVLTTARPPRQEPLPHYQARVHCPDPMTIGELEHESGLRARARYKGAVSAICGSVATPCSSPTIGLALAVNRSQPAIAILMRTGVYYYRVCHRTSIPATYRNHSSIARFQMYMFVKCRLC